MAGRRRAGYLYARCVIGHGVSLKLSPEKRNSRKEGVDSAGMGLLVAEEKKK